MTCCLYESSNHLSNNSSHYEVTQLSLNFNGVGTIFKKEEICSVHPSFTSICTEDNMSWDSYIDSLIGYSRDAKGAAHIDKACIIGMDGGMM